MACIKLGYPSRVVQLGDSQHYLLTLAENRHILNSICFTASLPPDEDAVNRNGSTWSLILWA